MLFIALLMLSFPFLDSCDPFDCGCGPRGTVDFQELGFEMVRYYQPVDYLNIYVYADDFREAFNKEGTFGSALMACDCIGPEIKNNIKAVRILSFPSFFEAGDSSDISHITREHLTSTGTILGNSPKFYEYGGGFNLTVAEKPLRLDTTYSFKIYVTKEDDSNLVVTTTPVSLL